MIALTIANNSRLKYVHTLYNGDISSYSIDVSPLSDDNGDLTTATIDLKSGSLTASTPAILSNVVTFNITQGADVNGAFILVLTFTNGQKRNITFHVKAKDWNDKFYQGSTIGDYC